MGYYTRYSLESVTGEVDSNIDYKEDIGRHSEYGDSCMFEQEVKWYHMKIDMMNYSASHPNILFEIHGKGEEAGDLWRMYFINGKSQYCEAIVTFESFDVTQLC